MKSNSEVVATLIATKGNVLVKNNVVKTAKITVKDNYVQVALTLKDAIKRLVTETTYGSNGVPTVETREETSTVCFTSTFAIAAMFKDDDEVAFLGNYVVEHPTALEILLVGANVDIIQQHVDAHTDYVNPFTTVEDATPHQFDNETYINHIAELKLSKFGEKAVDKIAEKLLFA